MIYRNGPFRFWCQKVLPIAFDDSLSYYEILCKVIDYLNGMFDDLKNLEELSQYVDDYFANLDVQEEIDNKLDEMAEDGTLEAIVAQYFTGVEEEISAINLRVTAVEGQIAEGFPHKNATFHETVYVDAVQGNDDNDGKTAETAVRSLDKALDIMNKSTSGIYIRFIRSGTYTMSTPVISGAMIHFLFDATNVTLNWLDDADDGWTKCFYSCYINMHGNPDGTSRLYLKGNNPAYVEGGKITISNMHVYGPTNAFGIVGGAIQSQDNHWHTHVYMSASRGFFQNDTFENVSPYHTSYIHIYNCCDALFRGGVTFKNANNSYIANLMSVTGSTIRVMQDIILDDLTLSDVPIYAASSQFLGGENRLMSWLAVCNLDRTIINADYISSGTSYNPS